MKFTYDHDLHIHSNLSPCDPRPEQTPDFILSYAKKNGLNTICLTDHYWDERVEGASDMYAKLHTAHIKKALPLPKAEGIRFLFGCETEMRADMTDPQGSYTGRPAEPGEKPVQDADDL